MESSPSGKFKRAKKQIEEIISHSQVEEDPGHAQKTLEWILKLKPDADEILQLGALTHDIERARPDRYRQEQFSDYYIYKQAHAQLSADIAARIVSECGYATAEVERLRLIIRHHEAESANPDARLLMDADSITYFDYNVPFYLNRRGEEATIKKILFMYNRVSPQAKKEINRLVRSNSDLLSLFKKAHITSVKR